MTKQLTALLAATCLSIFALTAPAAAADPEPDDTEQEEVPEERLGESSTTEEAEPAEEKTADKTEEKTEEETEKWYDHYVSHTAWVPGFVSATAKAMTGSGGFYDPEGDLPIDEPGQGHEQDRNPERGFPGSPLVLVGR